MPKRTRSHQLEDISIAEFQRLLPDEWVCRSKDKDYGIDLEVEVFDEQGNSTGLLFYVQLKATDSKEIERSISMKLDRLEYLASLDAPSMLVRYCDATHATHFMWISNIFAQIGNTSAASATIKFSEADAWDDETPSKVLQTVKVLRTIRAKTKRLPLGLTVDEEGKAGSNIFQLKLAVSKLQGMSKMVNSNRDPERCLPIVIRLQDDAIVASIDVVASITWQTDSFLSDDILPRLAYALAYMTGGYEFHRQALELVRIIHANEYTTNNRLFASRIAQLAIDDPEISADIAQWNRVHAIQDKAYVEYIDALLSSEIPMEKREAAIETFYMDAMFDHDSIDDERLSTIFYSFANFQLNNGDIGKAVGNYNKARKLDASYLQRPYFLNELGSCCFWRRHFKSAAIFYSASYNLSPNPQVGICAGDALLYSGDFTDAEKIFASVGAQAPDEMIAAEALIKAWLSSWLIKFYQRNNLVGTAVLNDRATWLSVIDLALESKEYQHALGAALVEAFLSDDDINLWADAMSFAMKTQDSQLILGTFSCAIWRNGYEVYALFREHLERNNFSQEGLEHFDQLANRLYEMRRPSQFQSVTMRLVGESNYDSVQEILTN